MPNLFLLKYQDIGRNKKLDLCKLLEIDDVSQYKFHAARWNKKDEPLDVFLRDREEWYYWNKWRGTRNDFTRDYIISFIKFYPEYETWIFGGIFKVLERNNTPNAHSYEIEQQDLGKDLIGRLKIFAKIPRGRAFNFETVYPKIEVTEILKTSYKGEVFPGYENISILMSKLAIIYKNQRPDWKTALVNMKGIYLLSDISNGKKYVGSAYGDSGIWSRWGQYLESGHGWNKELVAIENGGPDYARKNFRITLLEVWPFKTPDTFIISRESFWKEALLTRNEFGYNAN